MSHDNLQISMNLWIDCESECNFQVTLVHISFRYFVMCGCYLHSYSPVYETVKVEGVKC